MIDFCGVRKTMGVVLLQNIGALALTWLGNGAMEAAAASAAGNSGGATAGDQQAAAELRQHMIVGAGAFLLGMADNGIWCEQKKANMF